MAMAPAAAAPKTPRAAVEGAGRTLESEKATSRAPKRLLAEREEESDAPPDTEADVCRVAVSSASVVTDSAQDANDEEDEEAGVDTERSDSVWTECESILLPPSNRSL
jgi:hypothetical protein